MYKILHKDIEIILDVIIFIIYLKNEETFYSKIRIGNNDYEYFFSEKNKNDNEIYIKLINSKFCEKNENISKNPNLLNYLKTKKLLNIWKSSLREIKINKIIK